MQAYKGYVKTLLTRKNTISGLTWSEDPAIFALELANEPATTSNYEVNAGIKPGSIVNTWPHTSGPWTPITWWVPACLRHASRRLMHRRLACDDILI